MTEEGPHFKKDFTLQDLMEFSRDLELLNEDIDMMRRLCNPPEKLSIKKRE